MHTKLLLYGVTKKFAKFCKSFSFICWRRKKQYPCFNIIFYCTCLCRMVYGLGDDINIDLESYKRNVIRIQHRAKVRIFSIDFSMFLSLTLYIKTPFITRVCGYYIQNNKIKIDRINNLYYFSTNVKNLTKGKHLDKYHSLSTIATLTY